MSSVHSALRKIGNSTGIVIPRAILGALDVAAGTPLDLTVEDGRLVGTPVRRAVREGWAEDAARIGAIPLSEEERDWMAFGNEGDDELTLVKRGEVWLCKLDPTVGSEIRKTRPCVIVSPDDLNRRLQTVIVAPLTSAGRATRYRVELTFEGTPGLVLPDQMRAFDRARLVKRLGMLDDPTLRALLATLREMFKA